MAIVYNNDVGQASTNQVDTISIVTAAGHLLVAAGSWFDAAGAVTGITSITDSAGNTWHYSTSDAANPPASHELVAGQTAGTFVAWTFEDVGGVTSVTLTMPASVFLHWDVSEWLGASAEDTGNAASGTAAGANLATPSVTLATTGDLVVSAIDTINGTVNLPAGATSFPGDTGAANYLIYELPGTSGPFTFTYAGFGAGHDYTASVAAFKPPGGAAAATVLPPPGDDPPGIMRHLRRRYG